MAHDNLRVAHQVVEIPQHTSYCWSTTTDVGKYLAWSRTAIGQI